MTIPTGTGCEMLRHEPQAGRSKGGCPGHACNANAVKSGTGPEAHTVGHGDPRNGLGRRESLCGQDQAGEAGCQGSEGSGGRGAPGEGPPGVAGWGNLPLLEDEQCLSPCWSRG